MNLLPQCHMTTLIAPGVRSLIWDDDGLVDWVGGGARYLLDGQHVPSTVNYAYPFDAAVASPSGTFVVIYTKYGTKGLVLRDGKILREINRSFYQADCYEYPITLFALDSGQEVIAHCPDDYCKIDIDDLETGTRLTAAAPRSPADIFHSRLQASPSGRHLVSAGWVWHPVDVVKVYDIGQALGSPQHLDGPGLIAGLMAERSSAAFQTDGSLVVALDGDINGETDLCDLRLFDAQTLECGRITPLAAKAGSIMPLGRNFVLGLYDHPHVIDLASGHVVLAFPDIASGNQTTSINSTTDVIPVMAQDITRHRLAIADSDKITILQFDPSPSAA